MQTPMQPMPTYAPPPPRRGGPWVILGVTCGGCALIALILGLLLANGLRQAMKHSPAPPAYVGTWRYQDGTARTTVAIATDGTAYYRFNSGGPGMRLNNHISGYARINEKDKKLLIGLGNVGQSFHITAPPHPGNGTMEMKLDSDIYQLTGPYVPYSDTD